MSWWVAEQFLIKENGHLLVLVGGDEGGLDGSTSSEESLPPLVRSLHG